MLGDQQRAIRTLMKIKSAPIGRSGGIIRKRHHSKLVDFYFDKLLVASLEKEAIGDIERLIHNTFRSVDPAR